MFDASAKFPSGILRGNVNQYGDFDQCLQLASAESPVGSQYCLASVQLSLSSNSSQQLRHAHELMHSRYAFRSQLRDPGHRVPRFSSMTLGLCLPGGCSSQDVQLALQDSLERQVAGSGLQVEVLVAEEMCQHHKHMDDPLPTPTIITGCFFLAIIMLAMYGTFHVEKEDSKLSAIISGFSLRKNFQALIKTDRPSDDVQAVHGVRCLNALMLLFSHKCMAVFFLPYVNRTELAQNLGAPWSVIGRAASLYTDPFIMFSGMLTAYSFHNRVARKQKISVISEYVGRLFRLVPTLSALMLFCTWLLPALGAGPQWPLVVDQHAHICKKHWWRNFLFIHNYFGFDNICLTHTHHIGIDTQLFLVGVPVSLWLSRGDAQRRRLTMLLLVFLAVLSTAARFYVTYTLHLTNYVYFGISVERMFLTADHMYILPGHRFTVYAMGLLLGCVLRRPQQHTLTQFQLRLGWVLSVGLLLLSYLSPVGMGRVGYVYSPLEAAVHAALSAPAWCAAPAYLIYTYHHGYYTGFLGRLSSWRGFLVWTRLSYAVYLTQFPVFFYNIGKTRTPQHFDFFGALFNIKEIMWIMFWSVVLTLLFDLPFQNMKKVLFDKKPDTVSKNNNNTTEDKIKYSKDDELGRNNFTTSEAIIKRCNIEKIE